MAPSPEGSPLAAPTTSSTVKNSSTQPRSGKPLPPSTITNASSSSSPLPPVKASAPFTSFKALSPPASKHVAEKQSEPMSYFKVGGGSAARAPPPPPVASYNSDLEAYVAIGIGAGFALFLAFIVVTCVCCTKKRKKHHDSIGFYADPSGRKADNYNYTSGPPPKWQNQAAAPAGGGWQHPPQQPTLLSGNSDSGAGYSGPRPPVLPPPSPAVALGFNKSSFTYEELAAATNNFSPSNLLGQGGFGYVHKGVLPNGKEIAVKQLRVGGGQGEREFQAEVDIISRVHHRHLVSLMGYCISGTKRMLVYDFVPNRTLEYHLHGKGLPAMDWATRLKIAIGAAKGIAYLHEDCHPRIIHRDIKSANILLDLKFEAMVADFGLAKLSSDNHTHISTRVMGTFGYLAPEYASSGKLTEKSDMFSFGVMLLEMITGKRPVDNSHNFMEDSMVEWARPIMQRCMADGSYDELADARLENNYNDLEMARMVACANACVKQSAKRRPKMSQIVRCLEGDVSLEDLSEGVRPGSILFSSGSDYDSGSYTSNMNRFRKVTLASPEYSGDYSGPIAEFSRRPSASSSDGIFSDELNAVANQKRLQR